MKIEERQEKYNKELQDIDLEIQKLFEQKSELANEYSSEINSIIQLEQVERQKLLDEEVRKEKEKLEVQKNTKKILGK